MTPIEAVLLATVKRTVTWVKVEKPKLDLVAIILSSLGVTASLIVLAVSVGGLIGLARVRRSRALADLGAGDGLSLRLDSRN